VLRQLLILAVGCSTFCLTLLAITALSWQLHAWKTPSTFEATRYEGRVNDPRLSFSIIVPARHEEDVLAGTLSRLVALNHPAVEILVVVGDDDEGTRAIAQSASEGQPDRLRVLIDHGRPKNKPKALNTALPECRGDIVGVIDAEDEVHPALLHHVEACFRRTGAEVVQCGVQLVNYRSRWYSPRAALEYFFWFRSRLHFQSGWRFVPLAGNTVFVRRDLLEAIGGWDPNCLTEDCDLGARLAKVRARVTVAHDPMLATREEAPESVRSLLRQRTRWDQGFLQILRKGDWRCLPTRSERLVAWYTLAMPFLQALTGIMFPLSVVAILWLKAPMIVTLLTFVPGFLTLVTLAVESAGFKEFCVIYGFRPRWKDYVRVVAGTFPYQMLLAGAACRAVVREFRGVRNWEKTPHQGSHRSLPRFLQGMGIPTPQVALVEGGMQGVWTLDGSRFQSLLAPERAATGQLQASYPPTIGSASFPVRLAPGGAPVRSLCPWWLRERLTVKAVRRTETWVRVHWRSIGVVLVLLGLVGIVQAWGMSSSPHFDDDEGTYVAQAWAVLRWHRLSHYTYWYDHPPLGWLLLALWMGLTKGLARYPNSVDAGREAMVFAHLLSCGLLYVLARRLGFARFAGALAVILFSFSPLALHYHRMVLLDNIAMPLILAAFILALSPSRRLSAHVGSAACFAAAVLVKETSLMLLPAVLWQLLQGTDPRTRRFSLALFWSVFVVLVGIFPLFAALKGELLPGSGHVSLLGAIQFQLFNRMASGNVLSQTSTAHSIVSSWLRLDAWLLIAALLLVPVGEATRRLRPVTTGFAIQVAMLLRPGYLPVPYVTDMLPFAALIVSGVGDSVWGWRPRIGVRKSDAVSTWRWVRLTLRSRGHACSLRGPAVALTLLAIAVVLVGPRWRQADRQLLISKDTAAYVEAKAWILDHATPGAQLLVDDVFWIDLVRRSFHPVSVVWFYKLDLDPAIAKRFPGGWRDFDYVVSTAVMRSQVSSLPDVRQALENSTLVASFGSSAERIEIRKVEQPGVERSFEENRASGHQA
jgi:glycosyltransferase XagB